MDNLTTTDTLLFGTGNKKSFFTRVFLLEFFYWCKIIKKNPSRLVRTESTSLFWRRWHAMSRSIFSMIRIVVLVMKESCLWTTKFQVVGGWNTKAALFSRASLHVASETAGDSQRIVMGVLGRGYLQMIFSRKGNTMMEIGNMKGNLTKGAFMGKAY